MSGDQPSGEDVADLLARRSEAPTVRLFHGAVARPASDAERRPVKATPVLAITLGPTVGLAMRWDAERTGSRVAAFERLPGESPGLRALRYRDFVRVQLEMAAPALVVRALSIDGARRTPREERVRIAQEALLLAELEGRTSHVGVSRADVVRLAIGPAVARAGVVRPEDWMRAAEARWRRPVSTPEEGEALSLLSWALDSIGEELIP